MADLLVVIGLLALLAGLFLTLPLGVALIVTGVLVVSLAYSMHRAAESKSETPK